MQTTLPFEHLPLHTQASLKLCWNAIIKAFEKNDLESLQTYENCILQDTIELLMQGCTSSTQYLKIINTYSSKRIENLPKAQEYLRMIYFRAQAILYNSNDKK